MFLDIFCAVADKHTTHLPVKRTSWSYDAVSSRRPVCSRVNGFSLRTTLRAFWRCITCDMLGTFVEALGKQLDDLLLKLYTQFCTCASTLVVVLVSLEWHASGCQPQ